MVSGMIGSDNEDAFLKVSGFGCQVSGYWLAKELP
jgi:hypothetical protein